jgi:ABC-type glycerol-3-phosphate transport system substrate-binding protein
MDRSKKLALLLIGICVLFAPLPIFAGGTGEREEKRAQPVAAAVQGELVILNWLGGSEREAIEALEKAFMAELPGVKIKDINTSAGGGDARSGIRTALLGGDKFDLLLNTWPSFEKEIVEAGMLRPVDDAWKAHGWDKALGESWRALSQYGGKTYGVYFIAGNRSGFWYNKKSFSDVGLTKEPVTWDEFRAACEAYKKAGHTPIALGAKSWAQTELFENLILRTAGTEVAGKLSRHEISWTDRQIKAVFGYWKELLDSGYFHDAEIMLSNNWPEATDQVLRQRTSGFELMGSWVNNRARFEYGLEPGVDYSFFQFPVIKPKFGNTMSIDGKSWLMPIDGKNPKAGEAFIDFVLSAEGACILAENNLSTPSSKADLAKYDPVTRKYTELFGKSNVFFVLDDLLPAELSSEFRIGLQRFLKDPSESTIDAVMAAIEAKAKQVY